MTSATVSCLLYAAELSGISALAPYLSDPKYDFFNTVLPTTVIEATDGATGSLVRSQFTDAAYKSGRNQMSLPNSKALFPSKMFELGNASLLRNVGTSLMQWITYFCSHMGISKLANVHASRAVGSLPAAFTAYRSLVSTYVVAHFKKLFGLKTPISADPGTIAPDIEDIVAGLDSVAVVNAGTPPHFSRH